MKLKRYQIKKLNAEEILELVQKQTDSDNIKLATTILSQRNQNLQEKKQFLLQQIQRLRVNIKKGFKSINGRVRDRLQKQQKIILDKQSRPNKEDMSSLLSLFAYFENQNKIIEETYQKTTNINKYFQNQKRQLQGQLQIKKDFTVLDNKYKELNDLCEKQDKIKQLQITRKNQLRKHYSMIQQSIDKFRLQYEKVQQAIRQKQRILIQITTYYDTRIKQDQQRLINLPKQTIQLEDNLLNAQFTLNELQRQKTQNLINLKQQKKI